MIPLHAPFPPFVAASLAFHLVLFTGVALPHLLDGLHARPAPTPRASALVGDTFEVPLDRDDLDGDPGDPEPSVTPVDPVPTPEPGAGEPSRAPRGRRSSKKSARPSASGGPAAPPPASAYGAVGERGSVDLATAFTRGFPQASSADPAWQTVPFGAAGAVDVTFAIDAAGNLVDARVTGGSPTLVRGVHRTLALLRARSFTASHATTRLHLVATVSQDQVHDGLHGDVFAIGGSFAGGEGSGFFALAVGRRIDIRVTER